MQEEIRKSFYKLHLSIVISCFTSIFGRLITLNEGLLVFDRLLISFCILFSLLLIKKRFCFVKLKELLKILGVGFLLGFHWLFFYGSIKYANVSIGIICFSLVSLFTALIEPVINRHRISFMELFFSLITLFGIMLIFHFDSRYQLGIMLGVISSFLAALYTITNKKVATHHPSVTMLLYEFLGGTIALGLIMPVYLHFFPVQTLIPSFRDIVYLLLLSFFCTIGLYFLQIQVLKKISAFTVNLTYNLEPVYTVILAMIIFQENKDLNAAFYIGMGLIILSVILQSLSVLYSSKCSKNL